MSSVVPSSEDAMNQAAPTPPVDKPRPTPESVIDPSQYTAPMPTRHTIRMRTNLPVQAWRFAAVSVKMTRMILRSHH